MNRSITVFCVHMYDFSVSKVDVQVSLTIHVFMTFKNFFEPFDSEKMAKTYQGNVA